VAIMTLAHRIRRFRCPLALVAGLVLLGAIVRPSLAASPASWRAFFPPAVAYPRGTRLLPIQAATQAVRVLDPATATLVTRLGFVAGGVQEAVLPEQAAASVTVLAFHTARAAATFLHRDQPPALGNPRTAPVAALGEGARFLTGSATGCCGPTAPPLGILLVRQGTVVVQILTQPTDRALALRLGHGAMLRASGTPTRQA
jgi:hypothetical protein